MSYVEYYSQTVLALKLHTKKKKKKEWRFCIDYRALTEESELQLHPLPKCSHIFDRNGAKVATLFGVIDLTQGFHLLPVVLSTNSP